MTDVRRFRLGFLAVLLLLTLGAIWWLFNSPPSPSPSPEKATPQSSPTSQQPPTDILRPRKPLSPLNRPVSLLLIGVDTRKGDKGRADALMVLTIHPDRQTVKILNIPRDTRAQLLLGGGRTTIDKINHSYALGNGVVATVRTVEHFLDIPVDHFVKMDFAGFRALIDQVGGVNVDVKRNFSYKGHRFRKGKRTLNGSQALAYVRDRTGGSDFDRHIRQQEVLSSLWEKGTRWSTLLKADDLFRIARKHLDTNLTLQQAWRILYTLRKVPSDRREVLHLSGSDRWHPYYYLIVPDSQRQQVSRRLRKHLELETRANTK